MAKSKKSMKPKKLTSFPVFKKLAPELREMIWGFALPEANMVDISLQDFDRKLSEDKWERVKVYSASYTVPAILQTCQESRGVAQKFYKKIFEVKFSDRPVWFNPSRDILQLRDTETMDALGLWSIDDFGFMYHIDEEFNAPFPHIRRLQFPSDWDANHQSYLKPIMVAFGKPELIVLHKPNSRQKFPNRNFSRLKQAVEALSGDDKDDYKPELHCLTKYQLKRMIKKIDHPPRCKKAKAPNIVLSTTRRSDRFVERPLSYYEGGEEVGEDVYSDNESVGEADDNGNEDNSGNHEG